MAYKIDYTKTGDENLTALANTLVTEREFQVGEIEVVGFEGLDPEDE